MAVISGGYLRDRLNGVQPKDIDVFVPGMSLDQFVSMKKAFPDSHKETFSGAMDYVSGGEVASCHVLGDVSGIPIQMIELYGQESYKDRYKINDFGQCQCMDDGVHFEGTGLFVDDRVNHTFTLDVCEDKRQFDRSMRRWERLKERYPDHTLVIPNRFRGFM